MEVETWFDLPYQSSGSCRRRWQLLSLLVTVGLQDGQQLLSGLVQGIRPRSNTRMYDSPLLFHPEQMGQQL